MPTAMEDYLFDLRGFLILKNAIDVQHLNEMNEIVDDLSVLKSDEWRGHVHCREDNGNTRRFNCIYEAGEPFERLIDHPSWIDHINRYVGGDDGLFIQQGWAMLSGKGTSTSLHSGAHKRRIRTQFRYHNGFFRCGEINILLALNDIGEDDGPTMVVPGSHKSNLIHPAFEQGIKELGDVEGAVKVPLEAGDAILFVDCLAHGGGLRTTDGFRRILVYRYGPGWGTSRYGYQMSAEFLDRLTPERREIMQPQKPLLPPIVSLKTR